MKSLVGYTGFVGSNLDSETDFAGRYNSKNIASAYGTHPDLLVYAGLPAAKYLANREPEKDLAQIFQAEENIRNIGPKQPVLISTIDVLPHPSGADEDTIIDAAGLAAYGRNRYRLEEWVRKNFPGALIVRLPGLFGRNLKKNFLYDFLHPVPSMLREEKFREFADKEPALLAYYEKLDNGFYRCRNLTPAEENKAEAIFARLGFSALQFTDSRSVYQFYPLSRLWQDIQTALRHHIPLLHPATEPVSAGEVYQYLTGKTFQNILPGTPAFYDYRTKYGALFGENGGGYILGKEQVLRKIKKFVGEAK